MSVITSPFRGDELFPVIPVDISNHGAVAEHKVQWPSTSESSKRQPWNMNKALPSVSIEHSLSSGEMDRLHDLWNGAALSALAHRRGGRRQGPGSTPFKIPDPLSIPDHGKHFPSDLSSATLSVKSATPSGVGTRKRWGFLSARPQFETATPETEKKIPNTLAVLRAKAQERLKKKVKYTKSTPNLGRESVPVVVEVTTAEGIALAPGDKEGSVANKLSSESARKSVTLEELEEIDANAIYFTLDSSWRDSQGSLRFKFITPVPDDHGPLERPDSPLLHRYHSLDQLSSAMQEVPKSANSIALTEVDSSHVVAHPIDELHSYLEF